MKKTIGMTIALLLIMGAIGVSARNDNEGGSFTFKPITVVCWDEKTRQSVPKLVNTRLEQQECKTKDYNLITHGIRYVDRPTLVTKKPNVVGCYSAFYRRAIPSTTTYAKEYMECATKYSNHEYNRGRNLQEGLNRIAWEKAQ